MHQELRRLPELYLDCEGRLVGSRRGLVERVTSTRSVGIALNDDAVRIRTDILDVLSSWCTLVIEDLRVPGPENRTVTGLARTLDRHLTWLAGHPAAGDFAAEVLELAATARRVIDHGSAQPRLLGTCERPGCTSTVYLRPDNSPGNRVSCAAGHVWQPHEWLSLSRRMHHAAAPVAPGGTGRDRRWVGSAP
ncbi:hypothetical protein [Actinoplanes sp. NPDC049118]|uniref:hypothetical protein n=1 Tax=Actinoplanes sp. NPDC049118 TaxID=3155769 RepID=UPI00340AB5C1